MELLLKQSTHESNKVIEQSFEGLKRTVLSAAIASFLFLPSDGSSVDGRGNIRDVMVLPEYLDLEKYNGGVSFTIIYEGNILQ